MPDTPNEKSAVELTRRGILRLLRAIGLSSTPVVLQQQLRAQTCTPNASAQCLQAAKKKLDLQMATCFPWFVSLLPGESQTNNFGIDRCVIIALDAFHHDRDQCFLCPACCPEGSTCCNGVCCKGTCCDGHCCATHADGKAPTCCEYGGGFYCCWDGQQCCPNAGYCTDGLGDAGFRPCPK